MTAPVRGRHRPERLTAHAGWSPLVPAVPRALGRHRVVSGEQVARFAHAGEATSQRLSAVESTWPLSRYGAVQR